MAAPLSIMPMSVGVGTSVADKHQVIKLLLVSCMFRQLYFYSGFTSTLHPRHAPPGLQLICGVVMTFRRIVTVFFYAMSFSDEF